MVPRPLLSLLALLCLDVAAPRVHAAGGRLVSWGDNRYGQVSGTPTGNFSAVAAGLNHSVALRTDGTLVAWGWDLTGQVSGTPAGTFSAVAAGRLHNVAIRTDGTLVSWGYDRYGEVSLTPAGTFAAVAAGFDHSVAIRTDGSLVSWGDDRYGQVSDTQTGNYCAVAAGLNHSVALRPDGTIFAWGDSQYGQLSGTPDGTFSAVAAGSFHNAAIRPDGTLVSWGSDGSGHVVSGTPTGAFSAVACGYLHSLALRTDGTLITWGWNGFGLSVVPTGKFIAVAAGENHSVAIRLVSNGAPVAQCQNVIVSAGASCSAAASINNGSYDPDPGDIITLTQSPAGPYPLGQTIVTLTATDTDGASNQCTATVTVVDNTSPIIGPCPGDLTVNATSPAGAVVSFASPGASDNCSVGSVSCVPSSGSIFPIGKLTVTCTAMDVSGNAAACRFTVKVKNAPEQVGDLIALLQSMSVEHGVKNALLVKLEAAFFAIDVNDARTACTRLQDFLHLVNAQAGKKLTPSQATQLIEAATRIRAALGC